MKISIILCTAPNKKCAENIAKEIIKKNLAACVTLLQNATSYYTWNNVLEKTKEIQMLIKFEEKKQNMLIKFIKKIHPYTTPELLVIPVQYTEKEYLSWIQTIK